MCNCVKCKAEQLRIEQAKQQAKPFLQAMKGK